MGGMIAQILAATEPDRVASLAIVMSTTGKPFSRLPAWRVIRLAFSAPGDDASDEEKLAFEVRNVAVFNGPNFLPPETSFAVASSSSPSGPPTRPACCVSSTPCWAPAACWASARRSPRRRWCCTARSDPMLRPRNGRAVAAAIPGARYRRDRRHGPRPAPTGVAAGRGDVDRELFAPNEPAVRPVTCVIRYRPGPFETLQL